MNTISVIIVTATIFRNHLYTFFNVAIGEEKSLKKTQSLYNT